MNETDILLALDRANRVYWPGDVLSGRYVFQGTAAENIRLVEVSVLWHTLGKGEEDIGVHFFRRDLWENADPRERAEPHAFQSVLPNSPFSYDGSIVKVLWCVRLRIFPRRGRQLVVEETFQLGDVPRPMSGDPV